MPRDRCRRGFDLFRLSCAHRPQFQPIDWLILLIATLPTLLATILVGRLVL